MQRLYGIIVNNKYLISNESFETEFDVLDMNNFSVNLNNSSERSIASYSNTTCSYVEIPRDTFVSIFGKERDFDQIPGRVHCINFN